MAVRTVKPIAILLVDDEINVTRTLQMILEQEGYTVMPAYSAAEALGKFKGGFRPGIVITDLNMEKDDIGLEVARAAQKLKPRPIVVICTGYANVENASIALDMRVDHLLTKPVSIDELRGSLLRLVQERSVAKPSRTKKKGAAARG
jgi:two-component system cell cycle response regulator CpdR